MCVCVCQRQTECTHMYTHADKCNLTFLFCSRCFEILWSAYGICVHSVAYLILYKNQGSRDVPQPVHLLVVCSSSPDQHDGLLPDLVCLLIFCVTSERVNKTDINTVCVTDDAVKNFTVYMLLLRTKQTNKQTKHQNYMCATTHTMKNFKIVLRVKTIQTILRVKKE